jgi:hypothetical protein
MEDPRNLPVSATDGKRIQQKEQTRYFSSKNHNYPKENGQLTYAYVPTTGPKKKIPIAFASPSEAISSNMPAKHTHRPLISPPPSSYSTVFFQLKEPDFYRLTYPIST